MTASLAFAWRPPDDGRSDPPRAVEALRLLAGPHPGSGAESLSSHRARVGPRPVGGSWLFDTLESSGLSGRGGAAFPVARKWRAVAAGSDRRPLVVVNASEGEPLSDKDRTLVRARPHLILDGSALAAETVGASEVVVYISRKDPESARAIRDAIAQRRRAGLADPAVSLVRVAHAYVAGEASAVARRLSGGAARPQMTPPHMSVRGVDGRPTLVQNVETLAHVALIARRGAAWFRQHGTDATTGTVLMTVVGDVHAPGVFEVDPSASVASVLHLAGGTRTRPAGALLGGYFGTWLRPSLLATLTLDAEALRDQAGASLGCGVLAVLAEGACPVAEASRIATYLAAESAGQCGPCVFGLRDIAGTMARVAASAAVPTDVERLHRWARMVRGRGACRHPDGAVHNLESALDVFADHVAFHVSGSRCVASERTALVPPPRRRWAR